MMEVIDVQLLFLGRGPQGLEKSEPQMDANGREFPRIGSGKLPAPSFSARFALFCGQCPKVWKAGRDPSFAKGFGGQVVCPTISKVSAVARRAMADTWKSELSLDRREVWFLRAVTAVFVIVIPSLLVWIVKG